MDPQLRPYVQNLERLHDDIFAAVAPLADRDVNWGHPRLSNTVGILLRHVAGSERYWIVEIAGGGRVTRDRDAEFGREPVSKDDVVAGLRAAYDEVRTVMESLRAEDLTREIEVPFRNHRRTVAGAWVLLHSLQHTAYHLGQIQLFVKMSAG